MSRSLVQAAVYQAAAWARALTGEPDLLLGRRTMVGGAVVLMWGSGDLTDAYGKVLARGLPWAARQLLLEDVSLYPFEQLSLLVSAARAARGDLSEMRRLLEVSLGQAASPSPS